jgi:hypothetical protein
MMGEAVPKEPVHESAGRLREKLWPNYHPVPHPWLSCIVVGATDDGKPMIRLYTRRELYAFEAEKVPAEWEGFPVVSEVSGDFYLC